MHNVIRTAASVFLIVGLLGLSADRGFTQIPGRHGHNFPHPKVKKYRSQSVKPAKIDQAVYLYGNHTCPVMGDQVSPDAFLDYRDPEQNRYARVYLCCPDCKEKALENISEIYAKLYRTDPKTGDPKEARVLENKTCPVMEDEPASSDVEIEYNGMIVGFHHSECIEAFLENPEPGMARILPKAKEFVFEKANGSAK